MAGTDSIREAIDNLTTREKQLLAELAELRVSIRTLKKAAGIEVGSEEVEAPEATSSAALQEVGFNVQPTNNYGGKPTIRPDEFFGMTHAEASRRYLKKVGHAVSFEELIDVLQKGGCKLSGADPKKVLYISLIRNSRDFVPPQPGFVGLKEFYPSRARAAVVGDQKARKAKRPPKKQTAKGTKKAPKPEAAGKHAKKANGATSEDTKGPKKIPLAVREFMTDRQFHHVDEILKAVRTKLGENIAPVSIHGALSSKKFFERNEEGSYRMLN